MTHAIENSCELWHRRLAHINYKALPYICKAVTSLPKLKGEGSKDDQTLDQDLTAELLKG